MKAGIEVFFDFDALQLDDAVAIASMRNNEVPQSDIPIGLGELVARGRLIPCSGVPVKYEIGHLNVLLSSDE